MAKTRSKYALTAAAAATLLVLSTGCATTQIEGQIEEAKAMAMDAKRTAVQANQRAGVAESKADQASRKADEALACCNDTKEKIDRMFEKSMIK